jgi:osmotically inducible lipoprotein OsmB
MGQDLKKLKLLLYKAFISGMRIAATSLQQSFHQSRRTQMNATSKFTTVLFAALLTMALAGCADMSRRDRDTAVGAAVGGVAGAALTGSALGTVGGAAVGGVVGHEVGEHHDEDHR